MSGIQLSSELASQLKAVVVEHDPDAENDMLFMQYLSAVTGFVLAHQSQPGLDKHELIADLSHFIGQVMQQVEGDSQQRAPQEDAFGIWKPE